MHFSKLDRRIQEGIRALTVDKEFQERFGHDQVLDDLDDEKFNPAECYGELLGTLGFKLRYKGKAYKRITPLVWGWLWCIQSPIVKETKNEATQNDFDIFFYVLENGVSDEDIIELAPKTFGYCAANGIKTEDAGELIHQLISSSFAPLKMFPSVKSKVVVGNEQPVFDSDWLTSMVAKVHSVTGYAPDYIMRELSMTACCYYYVQYARMQGMDHIGRRTPEEILKAQDERACELILDRLIELKIITEEQRRELFGIMTAPVEGNK